MDEDPRSLIFKGATRPAMMAGVPIIPFILVVGVYILLAVWIMLFTNFYWAFVVGVLGVISVLVMRYVSSQDEQRLNQYMLRFRSIFARRNASHWGAHSISPTDYKKRS